MKSKNIFTVKLALIFYLSFLLYSKIESKTNNINIIDFGALGDGVTLNTEFIQKAIDKIEPLGGGTVIIPEGKFLSGSIVLKNGVNLHLENGAILLGSTNPDHYFGLKRWLSLILADGQNNISITGNGTIDGQGRELALTADSLYHVGEYKGPYNKRRHRLNEARRPQIIEFVNCKDIKITGVVIRDASCWVQTYKNCENLEINNITVDSDAYWNNDGIDIKDCKKVTIKNCDISSADDGICLKSEEKNLFCDDVVIENCIVRSSASAIKFGTSSHGGFKNVRIKNIFVYDTFRSAIALESVDGGFLEDVYVDGIKAVNTGNAIFIRLGHRNKNGEVGSLKNITIKNVKAEIPFTAPDIDYEIRGPELAFFHNPFPASITGIPDHYVENVTLENIEIIYPGKSNKGYAFIPIFRLDDVPENEHDYPEFHMFGELPSWGFYVRHVNGIKFKNINLKLKNKDFRPAFVFDDVSNLEMKRIKLPNDKKEHIILKEVKNAVIEDSKKFVKNIEE